MFMYLVIRFYSFFFVLYGSSFSAVLIDAVVN